MLTAADYRPAHGGYPDARPRRLMFAAPGHAFVPWWRDERFCAHMSAPVTMGGARHGTVSLSTQCGYPRGAHMSGGAR